MLEKSGRFEDLSLEKKKKERKKTAGLLSQDLSSVTLSGPEMDGNHRT